jgi:hypothetical protein
VSIVALRRLCAIGALILAVAAFAGLGGSLLSLAVILIALALVL